jgi:hypothetical protein
MRFSYSTPSSTSKLQTRTADNQNFVRSDITNLSKFFENKVEQEKQLKGVYP